LNNLLALRELAVAILFGGLIYVPLCLFEIRMSPQLHRLVYGFHPSGFDMTYRWGGYRPMVFMRHGLMLGMWMTCAAVVAVWLWRTRSVRRIMHVPMGCIAGGLVIMAVLCKSTGAILLLGVGVALLTVLRNVRVPAILYAALLCAPMYMVARASGAWSGSQAVEVAAMISEDRAQSLAFRLQNEDLLIKRAMEKPAFGWGGWGNWRVYDAAGQDITTSDGLWIITLGQSGLIGLASVVAILLLPVIRAVRNAPVRFWSRPMFAPCAALSVLMILFSFDCLANAMFNPIFVVIAGALSGFSLCRKPVPASMLVPARSHIQVVRPVRPRRMRPSPRNTPAEVLP
jgi:O-antigen ligase